MKKIKKIWVILGITFVCVACTKKADESEQNKDISSVAEEGIKSEQPKGITIVENQAEFTSVIEDQNYNIETDMNEGCMANYNITDAGDKVYYILEHTYVLVYDKQGSNMKMLCNKPDCTHTTYECNAYLAKEGVSIYGIQYYEGWLYYVKVENSGMVLCKLSLDGDEQEQVAVLGEVETSGEGGNNINWIIHRGNIYFTYRMAAGGTEDVYYLNGSNCIYRMSLDSQEEKELLIPIPFGMDSQYVPLKGYGSYVYFIYPQTMEGEGILYRYNIESDKIEALDELGNDLTDIVLHEGKFYYKKCADKYKNVYEYDEKKDEVCTFLSEEEGDMYELYSDDEYLYILCEGIPYTGTSSSAKAKVYSWDKQYKGEVPMIGRYVNEEDITEEGTFLAYERINYLGNDKERVYYLKEEMKQEYDNIPKHIFLTVKKSEISESSQLEEIGRFE